MSAEFSFPASQCPNNRNRDLIIKAWQLRLITNYLLQLNIFLLIYILPHGITSLSSCTSCFPPCLTGDSSASVLLSNNLSLVPPPPHTHLTLSCPAIGQSASFFKPITATYIYTVYRKVPHYCLRSTLRHYRCLRSVCTQSLISIHFTSTHCNSKSKSRKRHWLKK